MSFGLADGGTGSTGVVSSDEEKLTRTFEIDGAGSLVVVEVDGVGSLVLVNGIGSI